MGGGSGGGAVEATEGVATAASLEAGKEALRLDDDRARIIAAASRSGGGGGRGSRHGRCSDASDSRKKKRRRRTAQHAQLAQFRLHPPHRMKHPVKERGHKRSDGLAKGERE